MCTIVTGYITLGTEPATTASPTDMGFVDDLYIGGGPGTHYAIYQGTKIDVMKNTRDRNTVIVEKRAKRDGQCGKITDYKIQHAKTLPKCFDETPDADNYFQGVHSAMAAVDSAQWYWGTASLRYIKNGENELSRCLVHELNKPAWCTRFKPTFYGSRNAVEDNVDFNNNLQNRYTYKFYENVTQDDLDRLVYNVYASKCVLGDPDCTCNVLRLKPGCFQLCNYTDTPSPDYACSSTLDDYLLRYALGFEFIHPFSGVDCRVNGPCPNDVCHESFTLHQYYAAALGYKNVTHLIPNFEAAEHICAFNVGYFGDCYGSHEPCSYNKWNNIEYTTAGEFCYLAEGLSSVCRDMRGHFLTAINSLGGTLTENYSEEAISIDIDDSLNIVKVTTRVSTTGQLRLYKVKRDTGTLTLNMPPRDLNATAGNVMNYMRTIKQPIVGNEGGSHFITQPKGASPLTVNVVTRKPFFAFLHAHTHMSSRIVGQTGYHSRGEYYGDPDHRRTNIVRAVYSDYWMQNEWISVFDCIERSECTQDDIRRMLIFEWKTMFPEEPDIQAMVITDILDVLANQTRDGWHWQRPGNHNSGEALVEWAAWPLSGHAKWKKYAIGLVNSGWDLSRDGWVTASFRCASRFIRRLVRYNVPNQAAYWYEVLECGLKNGGSEVDITLAMSNEFPHMANASSPTGFYFPYDLSGGEVSLVPATFGKYNGVIITPLLNGNYTFGTCRYSDATRRCEPQVFSNGPTCPAFA